MCCRNLCIAGVLSLTVPAVAAAAPDPMLALQWGLADPAAAGAAEAWTQSAGAGVVVAVLDTGVQLDHPDLEGAIWTNPGEVAGNGLDDDHDGFVDDVHGANMLDSSGDVDDEQGHGTHVAGIIAARRGNGVGGSGMAPEATILPVKVLDGGTTGSTDTLARGMRYAVDRGARILNVSANTDAATDAIKDAVAYAGQHGAVVVSAAGNDGRNIDLLPSYPASLTDPAILCVGATTSAGRLWRSSNTGTLSVDVAAPGAEILSTAPGSSYESRTGTSAATAFVAGTLALLSAARPDLSMSVLRSIVIDTASRRDYLATLLSGGRVDAGAAMHRALEGRPWQSASADRPAAPALNLRAKSTVRAGTRVKLRWTATGTAAVTRWRVSLDGRVVATVPVERESIARRSPRPGTHRWRVVGLDAHRVEVVSATRRFKVSRRRT